jgi:hypothetical protein
MKTDRSGGSPAANDTSGAGSLEGRLAGRFQAQLRQAERDYPALDLGPAERRGASVSGRKGLWRRLAIPVTALAVIAAAALVGVGLADRSSGVSMGGDGIPSRIDGQRVYRVTDEQQWRDLQGSFLLGGYPSDENMYWKGCPVGREPGPEDALVPPCSYAEIAAAPQPHDGTARVRLAPKSAHVSGWFGLAVVVRAHTHDPEAAQCGVDLRAACEQALVVEAVVWPSGSAEPSTYGPTPSPTPTGTAPSNWAAGTPGPLDADGVPTSFGGLTVNRASNLPGTALSFLMGGRMEMDMRCATMDFAGPCPFWLIDGVSVRFETETPESIHGRLAVVGILRMRGLSDCARATCPPVETLVVTGIVWTGPVAPETPPPGTPPPAAAP